MQSSPRLWALVPAAGIGSRMGHATAKQYLTLHKQTVIEHTLGKLLSIPEIQGVMVAVREDDGIWPSLTVSQHARVHTTIGGAERAHSVLAGLNALADHAAPQDWVLVHDAARPCIAQSDVLDMIAALSLHPVGGVLARPVSDTVKQARNDTPLVERTLARSRIWLAQTPQMFRIGALRDSLRTALAEGYLVTDEASAMEYAGFSVALHPGRWDNIKITTPEDLSLAEWILSQQGCAQQP